MFRAAAFHFQFSLPRCAEHGTNIRIDGTQPKTAISVNEHAMFRYSKHKALNREIELKDHPITEQVNAPKPKRNAKIALASPRAE